MASGFNMPTGHSMSLDYGHYLLSESSIVHQEHFLIFRPASLDCEIAFDESHCLYKQRDPYRKQGRFFDEIEHQHLQVNKEKLFQMYSTQALSRFVRAHKLHKNYTSNLLPRNIILLTTTSTTITLETTTSQCHQSQLTTP